MAEQKITFFLVRHGEAQCNEKNIADCLPDDGRFPLTPDGIKQIEKIAKKLAKESIDVIVSSPMRRTKETAALIAEHVRAPIEEDERLQEMSFGVFSGRSMEEFWKKYPDPKMRISPDPSDDIESIIQIRGRLKLFLDDMKERYLGKKVVIVSHNEPLEQLHGVLTNESPGMSSVGWHPREGMCVKVIWTMKISND